MTASSKISLDELLNSLELTRVRELDFVTALYAPRTISEVESLELDYKQALKIINTRRNMILSPRQRQKLKKNHELKFQLGSEWVSLFALLAKESLKQYVAQNSNPADITTLNEIIAAEPYSIEMYEEKIATDSLHDLDENGIYKVRIVLPIVDQTAERRNEYLYCLKRYSDNDSFARAERNRAHLEKIGADIPKVVHVEDHFEGREGVELVSLLAKARCTVDHYVGVGETLQDRLEQLENAFVSNERLRIALGIQYDVNTMSESLKKTYQTIVKTLEEDGKVIRVGIIATFKQAIDVLFELNRYAQDQNKSFPTETIENKFYRRALDKPYPTWKKKLKEPERISLEESVSLITGSLDRMQPMITHGDFHGKNIVYGEDNALVMIDPERHAIGNIFGDVARLIFNHPITKDEHDELVSYTTRKYNQHLDQLIQSRQSDYSSSLTVSESHDIFLRAELANYLQLAVLFQKKAAIVKGKERKTHAIELANECYTEALLCMRDIAIATPSIEASFNQVIQTLEKITKQHFSEITSPYKHIASSNHQSRCTEERAITERSLLERTIAENLGGAHSALNQLVRTKSKVERVFDRYLKWPILAGAIGVTLVVAGYGLSSRIHTYFHDREIATLQEETRHEYESRIHDKTPDNELKQTNKEKYREAHHVRTELIYGRKQLVFGPDEYPYVNPYTLDHRLGSWYDLQRRDVAPGDWQMFLTPVEYYGLETKVDVNLLRAMIASFDWLDRNNRTNMSLNQKGEYKACHLPLNPNSIEEIGFNSMYDTCELSSQAINQNILGTAKRMSSLLERYKGNVASALWHFYKGDFYFEINTAIIQGTKYPSECFQEYWDYLLFEKEQEKETGKRRCNWRGDEDFVNIALLFYDRFKEEFGSGNIWEKSAYPSFKTPTNRDFYTP